MHRPCAGSALPGPPDPDDPTLSPPTPPATASPSSPRMLASSDSGAAPPWRVDALAQDDLPVDERSFLPVPKRKRWAGLDDQGPASPSISSNRSSAAVRGPQYPRVDLDDDPEKNSDDEQEDEPEVVVEERDVDDEAHANAVSLRDLQGVGREFRASEAANKDDTASNHTPRNHSAEAWAFEAAVAAGVCTWETAWRHDVEGTMLFGSARGKVFEMLRADRLGGLFQGFAPESPHTEAARLPLETDEDGYLRPSPVTGAAREGGDDGEGNQKKRKVPGRVRGDEEDGDASDKDSAAEEEMTAPVLSRLAMKAAAADLPKTAKEALSKLNHPSCRISLDPHATSSRRYYRRFHRYNLALQPPLALPAAPLYTVPRTANKATLQLPPGSTLKGSKALKFLHKLQRSKDKEKARVEALLGTITLPVSFWPTHATVAGNASISTKRLGGALVKSGLLTPPHSTSSHDSDSPRRSSPALADWPLGAPSRPAFDFAIFPSAIICARWAALLGHITQVLIARSRVLQLTKEEMELKLERAREAVQIAQQDKAELEDQTVVGKKPPAIGKLSYPVIDRTDISPSQAQYYPPVEPSPAPAASTSAAKSPTISTSGAPLPRKPIKGRRKRAAHANSLNSHHRDNYVPSRAPAPTTHTNAPLLPSPLLFWPASEEAIAAARKTKPSRRPPPREFFAEADEWMCAWCDYDIIYGDSALAVKRRNGLLRIRKRASERAHQQLQPHVPAAPSPTNAASSSSATTS